MQRIFIFLAAALIFQGCIQTIAIRSMGSIMDNGFAAFNEESDLQLAHEGLASNLKLLEALVKGDPENVKLLTYLSQGYCAYSLAFAEDDSVERARMLYLRGRDYGLRILKQRTVFAAALEKDEEEFRAALKTTGKDDIPALFWTALNWGSYINVTREDVAALADLGKVNAMMDIVREQDPSYYFGGPDMFAGMIEATTPAMLGGNPEKAKAYFEKAMAVTGGKFLLVHLYYAKSYCVSTMNQDLFNQLLQRIEDAPTDALPEARLANAVAKKKARMLKTKENDLF